MNPQPPANAYSVARPIYSNQTFEENNERHIHIDKSFHQRLRASCLQKALQVFKRLLPAVEWLSRYPVREWLLGDAISGVSLGLVSSLQGLAYALLVSISPVYGLYSAFFPILTYFFLGTSRHISVGPFPVTCLMVGSMVLTLVPDENFLVPVNNSMANATLLDLNARDAQRVVVACSMTVMIGLFQVAMGLLQVGFLVRYLSEPLVGGFTTAAAIVVLISQINSVLSLPVRNHNGFLAVVYTLRDVCNNITQTNIADMVAGLLTIVVVVVVKEINAKCMHKIPVSIPIEVVVTVAAAGISYAIDLDSRYGANIVRNIPRGFAMPHLPDHTLFWDMLEASFSTAVVGYALAVSVAKMYATKHDYAIDGNQELIAFGVSNIVGGCFSSFVASAALSRTAIQESTGGKTQVASLISAAVVLIVILALGPFLEPLQKSVLAAIVIANLKGMFKQVWHVPALWRQNIADCLIWIATFSGCIVLGLDVGLLFGLVFEMGTVVLRTQFPVCSTLGCVPGTDIYRSVKEYKNIVEVDGVKIFKCHSPVYFANVDYIKEQLKTTVGFDAGQVFRKRSKALKKIQNLSIKNGVISSISTGLNNMGFEERDSSTQMKASVADEGFAQIQVDMSSELPLPLDVPRVNIHSLVLDFSGVSFLDVVAVKTLRLVVKEFMRIGVNVYISGCSDEIVRKLEGLAFFDDVVTKKLLFISVHDAVLFIELVRPQKSLKSTFLGKDGGGQEQDHPGESLQESDIYGL